MKSIIAIFLATLFTAQLVVPELCEWLKIEVVNDVSNVNNEKEQDGEDEDLSKELDELFFYHLLDLKSGQHFVAYLLDKQKFRIYEEYHQDIPSPPPDLL